MTVVLMVTVMAGSCRQCAAQDFKPNFYCTDNPCNDVSYEVSGETGCPHTDHACLCVDEAFVESFPAGCECRDGLTRTVDTSGTSPSGFVCGPCTVCDHFHIKASPCMPEQDTVCVNCATACEPGAYVDACGSSSVACEPCTSCEAQSQFEAAPCTSTSDTLCCDACADAEQFVAEPCTRTTAATCTACTRCVDGLEFELRACGLTTDRVCQACTTTCAGPHEHVVTPCTPTSDAQRGCLPGYFESVPETPTSSRECIPCPQGTTDHDRDGTTACMACPFAITNTTANAGPCEELQCAPGTSGSQSCQPCAPPSHYQPLGGQTMCLNTTLCRPGFVEEQPPTPTTDRVCVACGHGTFSNVTADV
ncbi:hypothetical protein PTSG_07512 [Salpingoeca rosetta]|uniref:TNFR-Cys domain-containing protein n=1 Tax=Salpingoeca rosetta (strain ATCC 50818 / BSB-021) TaxID=946362 RepID=F2UGY9_SALR5|nr:uncharacterized protein PTSG_07512 [Salpingoeca rosetta]EGD76388.1 hypothetical protein PTSG_07512 [Salpingoeca rosetta]|eukprot:XP_004991303.1 hypothetical protein PTSG_07512 [Salpingoeca rosetta]